MGVLVLGRGGDGPEGWVIETTARLIEAPRDPVNSRKDSSVSSLPSQRKHVLTLHSTCRSNHRLGSQYFGGWQYPPRDYRAPRRREGQPGRARHTKLRGLRRARPHRLLVQGRGAGVHWRRRSHGAVARRGPLLPTDGGEPSEPG